MLIGDEVQVVSIVANTGGNQTIAPINPRINVVRIQNLTLDYQAQHLPILILKYFMIENLQMNISVQKTLLLSM